MNVRAERVDGRGRLAEERAHRKEHARDFQAQYSQSGQEPWPLSLIKISEIPQKS